MPRKRQGNGWPNQGDLYGIEHWPVQLSGMLRSKRCLNSKTKEATPRRSEAGETDEAETEVAEVAAGEGDAAEVIGWFLVIS